MELNNNGYDCYYDFDCHLYSCAAMLINKYLIVEHKKTGWRGEFKNITEFKGRKKYEMGGWLGERNKKNGTNLTLDDFNIEHHSKRNRIPFSKAKEILMMRIEEVLKKPWCRDLKVVIGGKDNYRKDIWSEYKANRPPKPSTYNELRGWLENTLKDILVVAEGAEADDILSIEAFKMLNSWNNDFNNWDLVNIYNDKDLKQCIGLYWDWSKKWKEPRWIGEFEAEKSFWRQMLTGDTTDNIPGILRTPNTIKEKFGLRQNQVGEKNSLTILSDCETKEGLEQRVIECYKAEYEGEWQEKFQLNYQLLKLQTEKGKIPTYKFK